MAAGLSSGAPGLLLAVFALPPSLHALCLHFVRHVVLCQSVNGCCLLNGSRPMYMCLLSFFPAFLPEAKEETKQRLVVLVVHFPCFDGAIPRIATSATLKCMQRNASQQEQRQASQLTKSDDE